MSIVFSILQEEHQRLQQLSEYYQNEISKLPKGSIQKKKISDHSYIYLFYRKNGKLISQYIGKDHSDKADELIQKVNQRKNYEEKLKQVKKDLKEIGKIINGKRA